VNCPRQVPRRVQLAALALGALVAAAASGGPARAGAAEVRVEAPLTDVLGALEPSAARTITERLDALRAATGIDLAVLLVDRLGREDPRDFAGRVFAAWGGGDPGRGDAGLLVIATEERRGGLPTARLHLDEALQVVIPGGSVGAIMSRIEEPLRAADFASAIHHVIDVVTARTVHIAPGDPIRPVRGARPPWILFALALGLALGVAWLSVPLPPRPAAPDAPPDARSARRRRLTELALVAAVGALSLGWLSQEGGYWHAVPGLYLVGLAGGLYLPALWRRRPLGRWIFASLVVGLLVGDAMLLDALPMPSPGEFWGFTFFNGLVLIIPGARLLEGATKKRH